MFALFKRKPKLPEPEGWREELNDLRTRVAGLELDNAERQVVVLNLVNKTLAQLSARERMHAARHPDENEGEEAPAPDTGTPGADRRGGYSTAHLARRFKGV